MKKLFFVPVLCLFAFSAQAQKAMITYHQAVVKALYLNCGNEIFVNVWNRPNVKNLRFEAENAEVIRNEDNKITLIPNGAKVRLLVFEGDSLLSTEAFPVRLLPKPDIGIFFGNQPVLDRDESFTKEQLAAITVRAAADVVIADAIPKDARYKASNVEVYLERDGAKVGEQISSKEERIDLENLLKSAQKGDKVVIEVKGVKRLNFRNETEDLKIGVAIFRLSIN